MNKTKKAHLSMAANWPGEMIVRIHFVLFCFFHLKYMLLNTGFYFMQVFDLEPISHFKYARNTIMWQRHLP